MEDRLRSGSVELAPASPGSAPVHRITLLAERSLRGTVRDAEGTPLAGAEVVVAHQVVLPAGSPSLPPGFQLALESSPSPQVGGAWPRTHTGPDGRYEIGGIHPKAGAIVLRASAPGHRTGEVSCLDPASASDRDWDIALARSVTVSGRVRAAGLPVEAAWVSAGDWPGQEESAQAWCDAEGRFSLPGVGSGPQHLWVARRGFAQLRHDVDVRVGMAALELELLPGHSVGGRVIGPDGAPIPWASVDTEDASGAEPLAFAGHGARAGWALPDPGPSRGARGAARERARLHDSRANPRVASAK